MVALFPAPERQSGVDERSHNQVIRQIHEAARRHPGASIVAEQAHDCQPALGARRRTALAAAATRPPSATAWSGWLQTVTAGAHGQRLHTCTATTALRRHLGAWTVTGRSDHTGAHFGDSHGDADAIAAALHSVQELTMPRLGSLRRSEHSWPEQWDSPSTARGSTTTAPATRRSSRYVARASAPSRCNGCISIISTALRRFLVHGRLTDEAFRRPSTTSTSSYHSPLRNTTASARRRQRRPCSPSAPPIANWLAARTRPGPQPQLQPSSTGPTPAAPSAPPRRPVDQSRRGELRAGLRSGSFGPRRAWLSVAAAAEAWPAARWSHGQHAGARCVDLGLSHRSWSSPPGATAEDHDDVHRLAGDLPRTPPSTRCMPIDQPLNQHLARTGLPSDPIPRFARAPRGAM